MAAVRQPGDAVLDTTPIWRTFASPEPGAVRSVEDAAIANSMKRKGLERAVEQGRDGYVIVASRDPARLSKWLDAAGQAKALLVTAPHTTLIDRARAHGPECEELLTAWKNFEADQEYMDLVDAWDATAIPDRQRGNTVTDEIRCAIECREDDTRQGPGGNRAHLRPARKRSVKRSHAFLPSARTSAPGWSPETWRMGRFRRKPAAC